MRGGRGGEAARDGRRVSRRIGRCSRAVTTTLLGLFLCQGAATLGAQESPELLPPSLAVVGGLFQRIDYHGEGTSALFGVRLRLPLSRHLLVEQGAQYTTFDREPFEEETEADERLQLLVLDFQVQVQFPLDVAGPDRLRPWVGVGAGGAVDFRDRRGPDDFLVSVFTAGGGVAFDVGSRLTLTAEGRYRTLDELGHEAVEASIGLGLRL